MFTLTAAATDNTKTLFIVKADTENRVRELIHEATRWVAKTCKPLNLTIACETGEVRTIKLR